MLKSDWILTSVLVTALIGCIGYAIIDGPKRSAEVKQDAENICLAYGGTAVHVMVKPASTGIKGTYVPATYAWNCSIPTEDGVKIIDPYK